MPLSSEERLKRLKELKQEIKHELSLHPPKELLETFERLCRKLGTSSVPDINAQVRVEIIKAILLERENVKTIPEVSLPSITATETEEEPWCPYFGAD